VLPVLLLTAALALSPAQAPQTSVAVPDTVPGQPQDRPETARAQQLNSDILDAYHAKEQSVGDMDGAWQLSNAAGKPLMQFELRAPKTDGGDIEGAWRSLVVTLGIERSGFVDSLILSGDDMEINYTVGHARSPMILHLHRSGATEWQGDLLDISGKATPVRFERLHVVAG